MGFKFAWLVELLDDLQRNRHRKRSNDAKGINTDHQIVVHWFNKYDSRIKRNEQNGIPFLSCMFPHRRPDRVYSMQEKRLASMFGKILGLASTRLTVLKAWKGQDRDGTDFPSCLESIMAEAEMPKPRNEVTVEEINAALDAIASNCIASSPFLKLQAEGQDPAVILGPIVRRLQSVEAKWLVRMLLKSFHPVQIPEYLAMKHFHFLLTDLLAIQSDFSAALSTLHSIDNGHLPNRVSEADAQVLKLLVTHQLVPKVGVMIKRQNYAKVRSIKHCCHMIDQRTMSIEEKYDGEYCQIHIDTTKGRDCIRIFSKSGKDSTQDRIGLHAAIQQSLRLGTSDCSVRDRCVLEGELLVWNTTSSTIQPFHKIRKHVKHGGRFRGHEADSRIELDERLMIIYHDVLLLDDFVYLHRAHHDRRRCLENLITQIDGLSGLAFREIIDFSSPKSPAKLRKVFARCIMKGREGLVLKSCNDSYFPSSKRFNCMKLKKDYFAELGDVADLAIVGARFCPRTQRKLGLGDLRWTTFYVGCLENRSEVENSNAKPVFKVIDDVSYMPPHDMLYLNMRGALTCVDYSASIAEMDVEIDRRQLPAPEVLFKIPFVAEILGSSFDKAPNATYYSLRHPRIGKIHSDRSITDTLDFNELQEMARKAVSTPQDIASQDDREWIRRLENADASKMYVVDKSQITTPEKSPASATAANITPRSPSFTIWNDPVTLEKQNTAPSPQIYRSGHAEISAATILHPRIKSGMKRKADSTASPNRSDTVSRKPCHPRTDQKRKVVQNTSQLHSSGSRLQHSNDGIGNISLRRTPPWCRATNFDGSADTFSFSATTVYRVRTESSSSPFKSSSESTNNDSPSKAKALPLSEVSNGSFSRKYRPFAPSFSKKQKLKRSQVGLNRQLEVERLQIATVTAKSRLQSTELKATFTSLPNSVSAPEVMLATRAQSVSCHGGYHHQVYSTGSQVLSFQEAPKIMLAPVSTEGWKMLQMPATTPERLPLPQRMSLSTDHYSLPSIEHFSSTSPILLDKSSLFHLSPQNYEDFQALLLTTDMSFTHSITHFLSHSAAVSAILVLVNLAAPSAVASAMLEVGSALRRLERNETNEQERRNGVILFMDWQFLMEISPEHERHFAGCLKWSYSHVAGLSRGMSVKACWDWKQNDELS